MVSPVNFKIRPIEPQAVEGIPNYGVINFQKKEEEIQQQEHGKASHARRTDHATCAQVSGLRWKRKIKQTGK